MLLGGTFVVVLGVALVKPRAFVVAPEVAHAALTSIACAALAVVIRLSIHGVPHPVFAELAIGLVLLLFASTLESSLTWLFPLVALITPFAYSKPRSLLAADSSNVVYLKHMLSRELRQAAREAACLVLFTIMLWLRDARGALFDEPLAVLLCSTVLVVSVFVRGMRYACERNPVCILADDDAPRAGEDEEYDGRGGAPESGAGDARVAHGCRDKPLCRRLVEYGRACVDVGAARVGELFFSANAFSASTSFVLMRVNTRLSALAMGTVALFFVFALVAFSLRARSMAAWLRHRRLYAATAAIVASSTVLFSAPASDAYVTTTMLVSLGAAAHACFAMRDFLACDLRTVWQRSVLAHLVRFAGLVGGLCAALLEHGGYVHRAVPIACILPLLGYAHVSSRLAHVPWLAEEIDMERVAEEARADAPTVELGGVHEQEDDDNPARGPYTV